MRSIVFRHPVIPIFLLVLIEVDIMGITIGTGIIESLVDAALMGIAGI